MWRKLAAGPSTRIVTTRRYWVGLPLTKEGSTFLSSAVDELRDIAQTVGGCCRNKPGGTRTNSCEMRRESRRESRTRAWSFQSMQVGLKEALKLGFETTIITPVDRPPLLAENLHALCNAYAN